MKIKKVLFSTLIVLLVCLLVLGGLAGGKKAIEVKRMAGAEVIEYVEENSTATGGEPESVIENRAESNSEDVDNDITNPSEDVCICVFGKSKVCLQPDSAQISACIEVLDGEMVKSKENNFNTFDKIITSLKEIGAQEDDIVMERFNCYPSYEYGQGKKIMGYYSSTCFSVKVNSLEKIKDYVNVLTENGVTNICNINYQVSDIDEQYNKALTNALENAKQKASKILEKEDLKIASIKEERVYSCNNLMRTYADDLSASSLIGKVEIEAEVLVEFK